MSTKPPSVRLSIILGDPETSKLYLRHNIVDFEFPIDGKVIRATHNFSCDIELEKFIIALKKAYDVEIFSISQISK